MSPVRAKYFIRYKIGWLRGLSRSASRGKWLLVTLGIMLFSLTAGASADTIVRSFNASGALQPGWIVALSKKAPQTVELAPASDSQRIYGVVIDPSQAPLTLRDNQGQKAFVATNGTYPVLVNTQQGAIRPGDFVSISRDDGIGAKATNRQDYILGQALEGYDGQKGVISGQGEAAVGRVAVTITPGRNPIAKNVAAVPEPLRRIAESLGAHDLSPLRIYASLVVFLATAVLAASILMAGVRSGMIAIGRNPLSRHYIIQGLLQVIGVAIGVFIIGVFAVYLLLKL